MVNKYFKIYKKGKEAVQTLKGTGKKTKGNPEKNPNVRKGISMALKDMKKKGFIGINNEKNIFNIISTCIYFLCINRS